MVRSLALGLHLLLAHRRAAPALPPPRPARGAGRLVWIHVARGHNAKAVVDLLRDREPGLRLLVTSEDSAPAPEDADDTDLLPADRIADVRAFLDHWKPDAGLILGRALPATLICEAHDRQVPLLMADLSLAAADLAFWRKGMTGSLLARFGRILARDSETVQALNALGRQALAVELGGRIDEAAEPLECVEAEREDFSRMLRGRPVWFAAACPPEEEEIVIAAHLHAMQYAHRLLLILAPADAARAPGLARMLGERGLIVAERSQDGEPQPDVQVLVTDGPTELGLWYRLAPMTYMAGSMSGSAPQRDPLEAAVLGSAIVIGPKCGPHSDQIARLTEARAVRAVSGASDLAGAVEDLIAPDRAAALAHNAWNVTTGGAEAAERVTEALLGLLPPLPQGDR